jgi:hypothetical protein
MRPQARNWTEEYVVDRLVPVDVQLKKACGGWAYSQWVSYRPVTKRHMVDRVCSMGV